jgi:hypothetical protein
MSKDTEERHEEGCREEERKRDERSGVFGQDGIKSFQFYT